MGKADRAEQRRKNRSLDRKALTFLTAEQVEEKILAYCDVLYEEVRREYEKALNEELRKRDEIIRESVRKDEMKVFANVMAYGLVKRLGFGRKRVEEFCEDFIVNCLEIGSQKSELTLDYIQGELNKKNIVVK